MSGMLTQIGAAKLLWVPVHEPRWPAQCACCNGAAETSLEIEFKETDDDGKVRYERTWQVPYCLLCERHVKITIGFNGQPRLGVWPTLGAFMAVVIGTISSLYLNSALPFTTMVLAVLVVIIGYKVRGLQQGREMIMPSCGSVGPAVICISHHQYRGDMHTFAFKNKEYGLNFQDFNLKS